MLGRNEDRARWLKRAEDRKERIQKYLWDRQRGLFFDYDFEKPVRSSYEYVATFYPLWAGLATPEQARAVWKNLGRFEQPGGLVMNLHATGVQWDYPYAWAPIELLAVEGLRRYGFTTDANRISAGERYASVYNIDYSRCIFCGYCVEACPTDAITHGHGFELAPYDINSLVYRKEQMLEKDILPNAPVAR